MDIDGVFAEVGKWIGGGLGGAILGYQAQKRAEKSEAVAEVQLLKNEYKEFAEYTKGELEKSRKEREDCQSENKQLNAEIYDLKVRVNELTLAMHNVIGTPKDIRK